MHIEKEQIYILFAFLFCTMVAYNMYLSLPYFFHLAMYLRDHSSSVLTELLHSCLEGYTVFHAYIMLFHQISFNGYVDHFNSLGFMTHALMNILLYDFAHARYNNWIILKRQGG